ncbi:patatin-like phospholipase family protein [Fundicoccus culcitae]|uniref:Patatin-like phospholipase family protein n=1 Tax=Fundicoccus culcitae TaxID=2969821 RepID=A0ABY5P8F8_9LACT|nr:patatin-like phospholipase family protein [Fundicoccus culcitae]UUX34698.1 patatin-like phospholipase family protein [Fundicoccus culcitae]
MNEQERLKQKTIGLSFSGGGAKSFAEVAILEELERKNLNISSVTGTSMGAFIAAGVAYGLSIEEIKDLIIATDSALAESEIFKKRQMVTNFLVLNYSNGFVPVDKIKEVVVDIHPLFRDVMLSELEMPIAIPAADLISGKLVVFSNQPNQFIDDDDKIVYFHKDISVIDACLASSSYPFVIQPMMVEQYQLVDGGLLLNSPANLFKRAPEGQIEYVISVGLEAKKYIQPAMRTNDVINRSLSLMRSQQVDLSIALADIHYGFPVGSASTFVFGHAERTIESASEHLKDNPLTLVNVYHRETRQSRAIDRLNENKTFQKVKNFFK